MVKGRHYAVLQVFQVKESAFLRKNTHSKIILKYSGKRSILGGFTGVSSARISISKINLKYSGKRGHYVVLQVFQVKG